MSVGSRRWSDYEQAYNALVGVLDSDSIAARLGGSNVSPCLGQSNSRSGFGNGREAGAAPGSSQALTAL
jgi:hypothetical protein